MKTMHQLELSSAMQDIPDPNHTNVPVNKGLEMLESVCIMCLSHLGTEITHLGDASFLLLGGSENNPPPPTC